MHTSSSCPKPGVVISLASPSGSQVTTHLLILRQGLLGLCPYPPWKDYSTEKYIRCLVDDARTNQQSPSYPHGGRGRVERMSAGRRVAKRMRKPSTALVSILPLYHAILDHRLRLLRVYLHQLLQRSVFTCKILRELLSQNTHALQDVFA
jgi:hypothetical protein